MSYEIVELGVHCVVHRGTSLSVIGTVWAIPLGGPGCFSFAPDQPIPSGGPVRLVDTKRSPS
jgi:hypothetical protein